MASFFSLCLREQIRPVSYTHLDVYKRQTRTTLMPPLVEAAHPPTSIRRNSTILQVVGHRLVSAVANPVVVMMVTD